MPVGVVKLIGRAVAQLALMPAHPVAGALQRLHPSLERLRATGAKGRVAKA